MDWGKEVQETEAEYSKHLHEVLDRPREVKEEKRAVSEIAVKKDLPMGITRHIGKFIGKSKGGKKSRKASKKTRRSTKRKHKTTRK